MSGIRAPLHRIHVVTSMQEDLAMWQEFLENFNSISFWREDLRLGTELQIHMDAGGSTVFGVYFRSHWCAEVCPEDWVEEGYTSDLTFLKFFRILVSVWLCYDQHHS